MKKTIILIVLVMLSGIAWAADAAETSGNTAAAAATAVVPADSAVNTPEAQKEKTIIVYDVYKHMDNSNNIFLGISGLSVGMGIAIASTVHNDNAIQLGFGIQSIIWGGAEVGLYLFDKNFVEKELNAEKARLKYAEMSGWHSIIDLAVMVAGGCLTVFGNNDIKGYGIGMMVQGAMLATYDGINFFIASNPKDVKDWGAGVGFNIRLANK